MRLTGVWRRVAAYFDHPDPRLALGGTVALAVVGNQPFYPFYVAYAAGAWLAPAFVTWLSTPLFLAAPALARRQPREGLAVLLAAAFGNTILTGIALGPASGVEIFYAPCLLLAGLAAPPQRRWPSLLGGALATAAGLILARAITPWAGLSAAQAHSLAVMHAVSAAGVSGLMLVIWLRQARG